MDIQRLIKSNHTYTVEQVVKAIRNGYKVAHIPISFYYRPNYMVKEAIKTRSMHSLAKKATGALKIIGGGDA